MADPVAMLRAERERVALEIEALRAKAKDLTRRIRIAELEGRKEVLEGAAFAATADIERQISVLRGAPPRAA